MKILIALDGSPNATECLTALAQFPIHEDARLHIVVVCDTGILAPHKIEPARAESIVEEAKSTIAKQYPGLPCSSEILHGPAPLQILQAQTRLAADLVLAGAHAPRPFPQEILGSVAQHIARHADCSVKLMRQGGDQNRMIVCLEHSEIDSTLMGAIKLMRPPAGTQVMFLNVLDTQPIELSQNPHDDARQYFALQEEQKTKMAQLIDTYSAALKAIHPTLQIQSYISDDLEPVEEILEQAKSWQAGTIVVGSHKRQGMEKFWLGSVSEPVAARAPCSVHIVRHHS